MLDHLLNVFRKDNLFAPAIGECPTMLDLDRGMCEASVKSPRQSDTGEISLDVAVTALDARYLKRVAAHSRNATTSIVNPFHRAGYRKKPDAD